jgi:transcriptional regulator with XRE-family HTH domain
MLPPAARPRAACPAARSHDLGAELQRARGRPLRLENVAARLRVLPGTLPQIETGQAPVKTDHLIVMLDLYGIDHLDQLTRLADLAKDRQRSNWWAGYDVLAAGTSHLWVEVIRRYSNRQDLLQPMLDVLRRVEEGDRADEPGGVQSRGGCPLRPSDRLSETDVREIVERFRVGEPKHKLAADYGMSLSTMKRLLRKHRP